MASERQPDTYDISRLEDTAKNRSRLFYKQLYVEGNDGKRDIDFDQTLIVTYSLKYRNYQQQIRNQQISRAMKAIDTEPKRIDKHSQNDYRRFIKKHRSPQMVNALQIKFTKLIRTPREEAQYDGFYAVYTNLDDDPSGNRSSKSRAVGNRRIFPDHEIRIRGQAGLPKTG